MKLLFVADGRSPTTLNWLRYWLETGHDVHLVSTFPCDAPVGLSSFHILPVAFSRLAGSQVGSTSQNPGMLRIMSRMRSRLRLLRYYIGPLNLAFYRGCWRALVAKIQPDLVHALRIPFEGMLASGTPSSIPLVLSTWGNDLTLHAPASILMRYLTRKALHRANGLMSDTQRDVRLAHEWGLSLDRPTLVVPGSGGIRLDEIGAISSNEKQPDELPETPIIVNSRGQRPGSLRQDIFFQSIPLVVDQIPAAIFVCPSLKGDIESERLVDALGIRSVTRLWPRLSQVQLWALFKRSIVFVSPGVHDGTPNSLLEAMACGCFPVAGDTESMREWIQTGVNGLLVDASNARSLADAIIQSINQPTLRKEAARHNANLIKERAANAPNMARAEEFYKWLISER